MSLGLVPGFILRVRDIPLIPYAQKGRHRKPHLPEGISNVGAGRAGRSQDSVFQSVFTSASLLCCKMPSAGRPDGFDPEQILVPRGQTGNLCDTVCAAEGGE